MISRVGSLHAAALAFAIALGCGSNDKADEAKARQAKVGGAERMNADEVEPPKVARVEPPKADEAAPPQPEQTKPETDTGAMAVHELRGIGEGGDYTIKLPAGFAVELLDDGDAAEILPSAHIAGSGYEIYVVYPEAGFIPLEEEKASIVRSYGEVEFAVVEPVGKGYVMIYRTVGKYTADVSSPELDLHCGAADLATLQQAEAVVATCKTLKRVK